MAPDKRKCIRDVLDELYRKYNHAEFIGIDPLNWAYKFNDRGDRELAAFFAALLAYGRVEQINNSLTRLFSLMGNHPAEFVRNFSPIDRQKLQPFKHRFNTAADIADLCEILAGILSKKGSLEKLFLEGYLHSDSDFASAGTNFSRRLIETYHARFKSPPGQSFKYLVPSPSDGSPCKRLNLFLRWMIRRDQVDPGLWKEFRPDKLIVPLDTHMWRLTKILGFHKRATPSLAAAREITAGFAAICPQDPVRYDFSLSRIGIIEDCSGRPNKYCTACELLKFCTLSRR